MFEFFKEKFDNLKNVLKNSAQNFDGAISAVEDEEEFSEFVLDDMEDTLIQADLGIALASELTDKLRKSSDIKPAEVKNFLRKEFLKILNNAGSTELNYKDNTLNIYFITGVNGAGKTTLIGKLAYQFKQEGKNGKCASAENSVRARNRFPPEWSSRRRALCRGSARWKI